jgi:hypothetical protein
MATGRQLPLNRQRGRAELIAALSPYEREQVQLSSIHNMSTEQKWLQSDADIIGALLISTVVQ